MADRAAVRLATHLFVFLEVEMSLPLTKSNVAWGGGRDLWPALAWLLLAVLTPTVCVVWFMAQAMRNERLAARQKLLAVYEELFHKVTPTSLYPNHGSSVGLWRPKDPTDVFLSLVYGKHGSDSAVVLSKAGKILYPTTATGATSEPTLLTPEWRGAEQMEFERLDTVSAAAAYANIAANARDAKDIVLAARALEAEARCFLKDHRTTAALRILANDLATTGVYGGVYDAQGRLIAPNALFLALQAFSDRSNPEAKAIAQSLGARLRDYHPPAMPSTQRRFLTREMIAMLAPNYPVLAPLAAEDLAADYLQSNPDLSKTSTFAPTPVKGVWQTPEICFTQTGWRCIPLMREERLIAEFEYGVRIKGILPSGVRVTLLPPDADPSPSKPLFTAPAGANWHYAFFVDDESLIDTAAKRQIAVYLWTGVLAIGSIVLFALLVARAIGRQMRLTRLKNDLIATVSHELKTPLSSMRVFVDTLLEEGGLDEKKKREYLELIAKENARLSRLIDNFLTFSRMERNKRAFEFAQANVADIVAAAADAVRERFAAPGCRLEIDAAPETGTIMGDRDALTTVLVNLLDNAWKYTGEDKRVILRARREAAAAVIEVEDNGIGIPPRAVKRIFDRFYQVDQSLSRSASGCGLGLSIVKFIVEAHGGKIEVRSRPGHGSVFTVRLPVAQSPSSGSPSGG